LVIGEYFHLSDFLFGTGRSAKYCLPWDLKSVKLLAAEKFSMKISLDPVISLFFKL